MSVTLYLIVEHIQFCTVLQQYRFTFIGLFACISFVWNEWQPTSDDLSVIIIFFKSNITTAAYVLPGRAIRPMLLAILRNKLYTHVYYIQYISIVMIVVFRHPCYLQNHTVGNFLGNYKSTYTIFLRIII